MSYKVVPKGLGHAEGGSNSPHLQSLFSALAKDLEALYTGASLNLAARTLRANDETKYSVTGTVSDEDADPIKGAVVAAFIKDTDDRAAWAQTAEDGTYTLPVYKGTYDLAFSKEGVMPAATADQTITEAATVNKTMYAWLEVVETLPEAGDLDVTPTDTIVITFDKALTDNSGEGDILDGCTVEVMGAEDWEEATISTDGVSGAELTLTLQAVLGDEKEVRVTIEAADTIKGPDDELLKDDYVFEFTTGTA